LYLADIFIDGDGARILLVELAPASHLADVVFGWAAHSSLLDGHGVVAHHRADLSV